MSPILPIRLKTSKPKHLQYPKQILTVGNELRAVRLDRGLTQEQVAKQLCVNRNFVYECELNHRTNSIYALHNITKFLGYIPRTLKIDETTLQGKLRAYRIWTGKTFKQFADEIGLDKSTITRFEIGLVCKTESYEKIEKWINLKIDNSI